MLTAERLRHNPVVVKHLCDKKSVFCREVVGFFYFHDGPGPGKAFEEFAIGVEQGSDFAVCLRAALDVTQMTASSSGQVSL